MMNGRKEHELKIDESTLELISDMPSYMEDYYYMLSSKTSSTKYSYVFKNKKFLQYLYKNEGINIFDSNDLKNIKPSMINKYLYSFLDVEDCTRASIYYAIKSFFKFLISDGYLSTNPISNIDAPKDDKLRDIVSLTKDEIELIKENIENGVGNKYSHIRQKPFKNRDMALIMLGLSTGMRISSIIEINVNDIDMVNDKIRIVEKGNKEREIFFSHGLHEILQKWLIDRELNFSDCNTDAVFISRAKQRMTVVAAREIVKKYTFNIDKKITPHKMRSTYATQVAKKTGNVRLVAYQLGHSNLRNTMRYMGVDDEMKQEAATAMDDILF